MLIFQEQYFFSSLHLRSFQLIYAKYEPYVQLLCLLLCACSALYFICKNQPFMLKSSCKQTCAGTYFHSVNQKSV